MCERSESQVRSVARACLTSVVFDNTVYSEQAEAVTLRLEHDIVPAQADRDSAANHRTVVLAAWLHVIEKHGGVPAAIPVALEEDAYQRFIAKALELSTAFATWNEVASGAS